MYIIELKETTKAFPKTTYYHSIHDEILTDVKTKEEARTFASSKIANHCKQIIEL